MSSTRLGRVQLLIMQVLWDRGQATAREITDAINGAAPAERGTAAIAHSTVQTLLRGLEEKGSIAHKAEGRTFVFYPLVEERRFKQSATRDLVERVFGGSVGNLVAHLLQNEKVSRKEIDEIRELIKRRDQK